MMNNEINAAASIPAGWKLVPIASTSEMDEAGWLAINADSAHRIDAERCWDSMLAAAPAAPSVAAAPESQPAEKRAKFEAWWMEFTDEHDDWRYADSDALRWAAFKAGAALSANAAPVTPKAIEEITDILLWPVTEDDARTARDMLQSIHFDLSMAEQVAAPVPAASEGWISVDERLPEVGQQVIAFRPTAASTQDEPLKFVRYIGRARESWQGVTHGFDCICHPTHWMPLPAIPAAPATSDKAEGL